MKHARIIENVAVDVITGNPAELFHPDIAGQFAEVPDEVETGWTVDDGQWSAPEPAAPPPPVPAPVATRITKRAFQERFPKTADGISTKFDAMSMFLSKDSYAETLEPDAGARTALQLLITTGMNRINASAYVDLALPDAGLFTALLLQPSIPEVFRLTPAERTAVLNPVIAAGEGYAG